MTNNSSTQKPYGITLLLLVLVFGLPLLGAHLLYAYRDKISFKTIEAGKLLSPPIDTKALPIFDHSFLGKWQLIYVSPTPCDANCQKVISGLNQIHLALGKEKNRVILHNLLVKDPKEKIAGTLLQGDIAIIDPEGWLIMQYSSSGDPKGILRDLRQLLRLSHGG